MLFPFAILFPAFLASSCLVSLNHHSPFTFTFHLSPFIFTFHLSSSFSIIINFTFLILPADPGIGEGIHLCEVGFDVQKYGAIQGVHSLYSEPVAFDGQKRDDINSYWVWPVGRAGGEYSMLSIAGWRGGQEPFPITQMQPE